MKSLRQTLVDDLKAFDLQVRPSSVPSMQPLTAMGILVSFLDKLIHGLSPNTSTTQPPQHRPALPTRSSSSNKLATTSQQQQQTQTPSAPPALSLSITSPSTLDCPNPFDDFSHPSPTDFFPPSPPLPEQPQPRQDSPPPSAAELENFDPDIPLSTAEPESPAPPDGFPDQDAADDMCFDDEGLTPLEKIYLFARSQAAFHKSVIHSSFLRSRSPLISLARCRVYIAHELPSILPLVAPPEAVEYVLPLLSGLAMDDGTSSPLLSLPSPLRPLNLPTPAIRRLGQGGTRKPVDSDHLLVHFRAFASPIHFRN